MSTGEPTEHETRSAPERRRIQSVAVGFRLIRALEAASAPMSLTQLAASADMPTSQAHLYLASYLHEGLVHQDQSTNRYQLGPFALRLGVAAMRALDVVALAREELDCLRERTGESAHFSVWSERGPCIVLNVNGARPLPFASRLGFVLPLLSTATGRAFLAHLRKGEGADLLHAERTQGRWSASDIEAITADVRRQGLSFTANMLNSGLAALAAPVFDYAGAIQGVVTLIGPSEAFPADLSSAQGAALRESARALCARLGKPG